MRKILAGLTALMTMLATPAYGQLGLNYTTFTPGQVISSSQFTENFTNINNKALNRTGGTATGAITFSSGAEFDGSFTIGSGNLQPFDSTGKLKELSSTYVANLSGANLTGILEANIADGTVLARLAANETVSGTWTFGTINLTTLTCTDCIGATQLNASNVSPGSYGSATGIPLITIDVDGRITFASTTPTSSLSGLVEDGITDGSILARVAANETISGTWTFSNTVTASVLTSGTDPVTRWIDTDGGANSKNWRIYANSSNFAIQTLNDALDTTSNGIVLTRSANSVTTAAITGNTTITGTLNVSGAVTGSSTFTGTQFNGTQWVQTVSQALGTGAVSAPFIAAGYNTSGNGAAGCLIMISRTGSSLYLYQNAGLFRYNISSEGCPTENDSQPHTGSVVGDQTSQLKAKNLGRERNDFELLEAVLKTKVYDFVYKDGRYNGETFTGIVTDYAPWFGKDNNKALNEINGLGYTIGAIKAVHAEVHTVDEQNKLLLKVVEILAAKVQALEKQVAGKRAAD